MWRCCICLDGDFTDVKDYAAHVEAWHEEWLDGKRIPPYAMKPSYVVEAEELDRELSRSPYRAGLSFRSRG